MNQVITQFFVAACMMASRVHAETLQQEFGMSLEGEIVYKITLSNKSGTSASVITYGAALHEFKVADKFGKHADIVLSPATLAEIESKREFFGSTVGRVANRIAKGRFTINGDDYQIPVNNLGNALHGGRVGLDVQNWTIEHVQDGPSPSVTLSYLSPDGESGFPGNLQLFATYTLEANSALTIKYSAETNETTIVNISNHTYWNLAGEGSSSGVMGHILQISADHYLPVDETLIPTGEFASVDNTVFDFRTPTPIGLRVRDSKDPQIAIGRGYDHNFVVSKDAPEQAVVMARVFEPESGRVLIIKAAQPGIQFYSGNFLDGTTIGKSGAFYRQGDAFVLEPQMLPDAINQTNFGSIILEPGKVYSNTIIFRTQTATLSEFIGENNEGAK